LKLRSILFFSLGRSAVQMAVSDEMSSSWKTTCWMPSESSREDAASRDCSSGTPQTTRDGLPSQEMRPALAALMAACDAWTVW
jgi:hypothetical protein